MEDDLNSIRVKGWMEDDLNRFRVVRGWRMT